MADGSHDESRWIQTVDLFIPETQPPKRAHIPQTTHLQTLWSWKYSIGAARLSVKQAAAVSTQQNEMSLWESVDLWFCLARALGVHLLGGLWFCGANKQQPLQNHLSHLNHSDLLCCSAWLRLSLWMLWLGGNQRDTWLDSLESGERLFPCQHLDSCWVWCAIFPEKTESACRVCITKEQEHIRKQTVVKVV